MAGREVGKQHEKRGKKGYTRAEEQEEAYGANEKVDRGVSHKKDRTLSKTQERLGSKLSAQFRNSQPSGS